MDTMLYAMMRKKLKNVDSVGSEVSKLSEKINNIESDYVKSADIPTVPSKVSELDNDRKYQTADDIDNTLTSYAKLEDVTTKITTEVAKIVADAPEDFDTLKEMSDWIAGHENDASAMNSAIQQNKTDISELNGAKADKTEIPTKVSELSNDSGFTTNKGTITGITVNGVSKGTSGVVNLGTVITQHQDISGKVDKDGNKVLSDNNYTTAEKNKLAELNNYDDTKINADIADINAKLEAKVDKNVLNAILNNRPTVDTIDEFLELQRNEKVYMVKIPKFASNPTCTCEKLGANTGLEFEPSTDTVEGKDDYADKIEFMWWHNNYIRNDDGYAVITALETDENYTTTGSVDVGSCGMSFYYKWDDSNEEYTMLYWSPSPHPELGLIPFSANVPGHSYWCLSAYPSVVASDGLLRSQPNGKIARKQSYSGAITNYQKKGKGYWGAGAERNTLQIIFNLLMGGTKNSQSLYAGVTSWNIQYNAAVQRDTADTYFPVTAAQADKLEVGCCVSVGYARNNNGTLYQDRDVDSLHYYADDVRILRIEDMADGNKAVYLDVETGFTTTPVALTDELYSPIIMSTMHALTGETDSVCAKHNGSAVSNTSGRHSYRVQGVEYGLGAYIIAADTVVEFQSDYSKNVYAAPKGIPHSTNTNTIKNTYTLIGNIPASADGNGKNYWIGDVNLDEETGVWYPQTEGSSNSTGMADMLYAGGKNTSGAVSYLQGGTLWSDSNSGSALLACIDVLAYGRWNFCSCD